MLYKKIDKKEFTSAINLAWKVFGKFEAPCYSEKGIKTFYDFIHDEKCTGELKIYGAFDDEALIGILATRNNGTHISLFFVDEKYQNKGIGKKLFKLAQLDNVSGKMTVNSSPYAVNIYHRLGFVGTGKETVIDGIRFTPMEYDDTVIKTERLILRPWKISDAKDLYEYAKDPDIGPIAGWPPHTSVENSMEIIKTILSAPETYAVVLIETNRPIGSVGIMFLGSGFAPIKENEAEIGYWIGKPYWGLGLIPEAVNELIRRCFCELSCTGIWCGYYDGNRKSKRVQEKCGFTYHHAGENAISPMGDNRTEHFTYLAKNDWKRVLI